MIEFILNNRFGKFFVNFFRNYRSFGKSMCFIGKEYKIRNGKCYPGDKVLIHPVFGVSQAKKTYPGKIVVEKVKGQDGFTYGDIFVLQVIGINENSEWKGGWMNEYLFNRLELIRDN